MQQKISSSMNKCPFCKHTNKLVTIKGMRLRHKMKTIRSITHFYKSFAFASWIITLSCVFIAYYQGIMAFTALFWFKIITLGLIVYFISSYKRDEFYYYKNLGLSKLHLWVSTLLFDFILFIFLIVLTLKIR